MSTWYYQWLNIHCGKWTLWNRSTWVSTWKTRHWVFSVGDRFILWHWKPNIVYPPYIWFITFTLLDFHYIITDHGDLTRPTKRQLQININMITALPPTVPVVNSEIKSWFLRLLSLVCIRRFTTRFLPTRLMRRRMNRQVWLSGLRGKNERKKDLIDWMRASGPRHPGFIASNGRVAGQRTEQSSHFQDQPFLHGHFFSLELLPPKKRIRDAFNAYTLLIMLYTVA